MKIVHLIPRDVIGGVETAARSAAAVTPPADIQFRLQLISGTARDPAPSLVQAGAPMALHNPLAHLLAWWRLLQFRPDVLICSIWWSTPVGLFYKLCRLRTKIVLFLHNEEFTSSLDRYSTRLMQRFASEIWADSEKTVASILGSKQPCPIRVISFVTKRFFVNQTIALKPAKPRFIFWGRLAPQKAVDRAILLFAKIQARFPEATFSIIGPDSGELTKLKALVSREGLDGSVLFQGPKDHEALAEAALTANFYLQLSRYEGLAMSVIEAMPLGLVPVVTPVGEIPAYCRNGQNSIFVDEDIKAVETVKKVLQDPSLYAALRRAALARWAAPRLYADDFFSAAAAAYRKTDAPGAQ